MLTQEQRHNMIESFKATNGEETAMALAESLFSNDLATKTDISRLDAGLDKLEAKVDAQFRWLVGLLIMILIAVLGAGIFG